MSRLLQMAHHLKVQKVGREALLYLSPLALQLFLRDLALKESPQQRFLTGDLLEQ